MTHSSNIPVSSQLEEAFGKARTEGGVRFIKAHIKDEQLLPILTQPLGNLESDFGKVVPLLEPKTPSYFIFRLDTQNTLGYEWLLLAYVPDGSSVKDRMLYASTRDSLKKQLGKSYFVTNDMYGSETAEFTWEAYQDILQKPFVAAPLTASEMHLSNEVHAEIDHGGAREYVHSVRFPLSNDAQDALRNFSTKQNFVQLSVDTTRETIELVSIKKVAVGNIPSEISTSEPRFVFFKYTHTFQGEAIDSNVFIYCCPENAHVKKKMLYSTVKSVVAGAAEDFRIVLDKTGKIEVDDPELLTVDYLNESLHPVKEVKKGFARPLRPGKGGARLIKNK